MSAPVSTAAPALTRDDPMRPRPFRVTSRRQDTSDTFTLDLEPAEGAPVAWAPGQFTMLMAYGIGEVPISISGDPARTDLLQHTVRDVGAVTHALVSADPGAVLGVRGPYGAGWAAMDGAGGDIVIVAGGIGLAPLRPALLQVLARRDEFDRVVLLYGARSPQDLLYDCELHEWAARSDLTVGVTVDYGPSTWTGRVGTVTSLIPLAGFDPARTLALVCGPEVMMRYTAIELVDRGVPARRIRLSFERNMQCGVGLCGHCQLREFFACVDGPVLSYEQLGGLLSVREL